MEPADPCPFCGDLRIEVRSVPHGPESDERDYYCFCPSCACHGPWTKSGQEGAVSRWNRRYNASFMAKAIAGQFQDCSAAIDDAIASWHGANRRRAAMPSGEPALHNYLGMTWDEYRAFVDKPTTLAEIIAARRSAKP